MKISPDSFIAVIIASFGILVSLSVGFQLFFKKEGIKQSKIFLGLLLLLYSLTLFNSVLAMTGVYSAYQHLYFLPLVFSWSIGPLFYFFVRSRIQTGFQFKREHLVHFILPSFQFLFYLSIGFRSVEFKSWIWRNVISQYGQFIEEAVNIGINLVYVALALQLINTQLPKELWKHPVCLWLKRFAVSLLVLLGLSSFYEITDWILWGFYEYNLFNTPWLDFPLKLAYGLISLSIGYNAFLYQHQAIVLPKLYTQSDDGNIKERIDDLFATQKVYLDPELNLESFSKLLDIHKNQLSKHFSSEGKSFRAVINEQRLNHFLQLVEKNEHQNHSLLGLAFESGFNSKSSFNRIFKERLGVTPREFVSKKEIIEPSSV